MQLRLYHSWRSSSSWRVRWAFALKNVPCELVAVSMLSDAADTTGYFDRNPTGYVPVLECLEADAPFRFLGESVAIIEWAEEVMPTPALLPADGWSRARTRQLVQIINAGTQPLQNLSATRLHSSDPAERLAWNRHWIRKGLGAYEALVRDRAGRFSMGDAITMADLFLTPQCYNAVRHDVALADYPTVARIYDAALACSSCAATRPERGESTPAP